MTKKSFGKKIIQELLDIIFPVICLGCNKEGRWLCKQCLERITLYQKPVCPWCEKSTHSTELCNNCKRQSHLDFLFVITTYQNFLLQELLHNLKYNFAWKIAEDLNPLAKKYLSQPKIKQNEFIFPDSSLLLAPIPLHKKRFLERGFNQSEFLAKIIARRLNAELSTDILIRKKNTISQMTLNRKERSRNIQGAFQCLDPKLVKDKKIVIIDDVLTTGATIKEAAFTLRKAGCHSVSALVLAKEELISQAKNGRVN